MTSHIVEKALTFMQMQTKFNTYKLELDWQISQVNISLIADLMVSGYVLANK